jgi:hypothetical protein
MPAAVPSFPVVIRNLAQTNMAIGLYVILKFINYLEAQPGNFAINATTRSSRQRNLFTPLSSDKVEVWNFIDELKFCLILSPF